MAHIITVPAFSDNYIWLVCNDKQDKAAIVDPGDAKPVIAALKENNITPAAILITHFHNDHVGGISDLLEEYPNLPVYGPYSERIPHITTKLGGDETIRIEEIDAEFKVMNVYGHTAGHIAYFTEAQGQNRLFCGDTIFAAGCGRVFNGTMEQLHDSLAKIAKLPEDTLLYCAHEYTMANIGFAKWVEPESVDLLEREKTAQAMRDDNIQTVPSLLSLEIKTNPFLRTHLNHVVERVASATGKTLNNSTEVFAAMRTWKDTEYD